MKPFHKAVELNSAESITNNQESTHSQGTPLQTESRDEGHGTPAIIEPSSEPQVTNESEVDRSSSRPQRVRRTPQRYACTISPWVLFMIAAVLQPLTAAVLVKENILFVERLGLAFSESTWTIVTDLDLAPA